MLTMTNVVTKGRKKDNHKGPAVARAKPKSIKKHIKDTVKLAAKKEPTKCKRKITESVMNAEHSLPKRESEPSKSAKSEPKSAGRKKN